MAIYPNGWKSPEIQQACGFTSHSYRLGEIFNVMCFVRSGCRYVVVLVVFDVVLFVGGLFLLHVYALCVICVCVLLLLFLFVFCLFVVVCVLVRGRGCIKTAVSVSTIIVLFMTIASPTSGHTFSNSVFTIAHYSFRIPWHLWEDFGFNFKWQELWDRFLSSDYRNLYPSYTDTYVVIYPRLQS